MDLQRGIIFIGLAIVSYLMVLAWNEDYGQPQVTQTPTQVQQPESLALPSNPSPETVGSDEFEPPEQRNEPTVGESSIANSQSTTLIEIKTDVLDLIIDPRGGNIVQALLPGYNETLNSDTALSLLQNNAARRYVLESGLFGKNGFDSSRNGPMPLYQTTQNEFVLHENEDELKIDLVFNSPNRVKVTKRFTMTRGSYLIKVDYIIENNSSEVWEGNFSAKIVRDQSADPSQQNSMGMQSFLGMVLSTPNEPYEKYSFDDLKEKPINQTVQGGWVAFIQHYFISAWIPNNEITHTYQSKVKSGNHLMGFISPVTVVQPGETAQITANAFIGPKLLDQLETAANNLDLTVDYGILFFIAYPLFLLLELLHGFVGNWGVAIILVTVIVKALFFHLSATSYRSMAGMRKVAPQLQRMKEQYGDDRQKMSQAMMELYRKEKINPLGGCLPILVQMPVFIALYWVLMESVQLRHAPFAFWIVDLSQKDPYFLLPILMGATMFIQMHLNPTPPDPVQARVMKMMPIIFTVFFLWFPSGLVLYWLVNNILSIAQQWYITRQIEGADAKKV
ncbi:MAG: membrane protein insertase YidC [Pseudomonadales bacterium]|nr:membrane protein insertase YidC [Pseudomonadales bacterium]